MPNEILRILKEIGLTKPYFLAGKREETCLSALFYYVAKKQGIEVTQRKIGYALGIVNWYFLVIFDEPITSLKIWEPNFDREVSFLIIYALSPRLMNSLLFLRIDVLLFVCAMCREYESMKRGRGEGR